MNTYITFKKGNIVLSHLRRHVLLLRKSEVDKPKQIYHTTFSKGGTQLNRIKKNWQHRTTAKSFVLKSDFSCAYVLWMNFTAKQVAASKVENTFFVEWKVRENEISKSSISLFPSFEVRTPASLNSFDEHSVATNIHAKSLALLIFKNNFFRYQYLKHKASRWYSFKQWNSFFHSKS